MDSSVSQSHKETRSPATSPQNTDEPELIPVPEYQFPHHKLRRGSLKEGKTPLALVACGSFSVCFLTGLMFPVYTRPLLTRPVASYFLAFAHVSGVVDIVMNSRHKADTIQFSRFEMASDFMRFDTEYVTFAFLIDLTDAPEQRHRVLLYAIAQETRSANLGLDSFEVIGGWLSPVSVSQERSPIGLVR